MPSAMIEPNSHQIVDKLARLRTELIDLAFVLERQGRPEAADVAMTTSARLEELCEEIQPQATSPCQPFAAPSG
jgi:hypothetical protein